MGIKPLLSGIVCLVFVMSAVAPEALAKRKKRSRSTDAAEETASDAAEENGNGDAAEEVETEEAEEKEEPEAADAPKSISDQLNDGEGEGGMRRSNRMEFDERLVKGQAAKSGAVYLFKRVPRHLPGLVPMRRSYRQRIVQPILGNHTLKPARYSFEVEKALQLKKQKAELDTGAPPVVEQPTAEPEEASEEAEPEEAPLEENGKKDKGKRKKKKKNRKN